MALQLYQLPLASSVSSSSPSSAQPHFLFSHHHHHHHQHYTSSFNAKFARRMCNLCLHHNSSINNWKRRKTGLLVGKEDLELRVPEEEDKVEEEEEEEVPPSPQDLQYVQEIKRVCFHFLLIHASCFSFDVTSVNTVLSFTCFVYVCFNDRCWSFSGKTETCFLMR